MSFLISKFNECKDLLSSPLGMLLSMGLLMFIVIGGLSMIAHFYNISRKAFEEYVLEDDDLNIRQRIKHALSEISKKRLPVNEVLLIGGSSQIPLIKEIIVEVFDEMRIDEKHIYLSNDFEQAVAKGAAIQSAIIEGVAIISPFESYISILEFQNPIVGNSNSMGISTEIFYHACNCFKGRLAVNYPFFVVASF